TLLTHQEEHAHGRTFLAQLLAGANLRRDNAFGVTGAAPVDIVLVFRGRDEWRHRVHMRGENDLRRLLVERGYNVEALMRHRHLVSGVAQPAELIVELRTHCPFLARG